MLIFSFKKHTFLFVHNITRQNKCHRDPAERVIDLYCAKVRELLLEEKGDN